MTNGITNWNILTNIFGDNFQFTDAVIDNLKTIPLDRTVSIGFITDRQVLHPPAKWERWDKVCICIDFAFVKEVHYWIQGTDYTIRSCSIQKTDDVFRIEIQFGKNDSIAFFYEAARIQNVKPMVYLEQFGRYEAL